MKGTLFSADFVVGVDENPKLLEINTDTAFIDTALPLLNLNDFLEVLETNSITEVHIVYKPLFHANFVDFLEDFLIKNAPFVTGFFKYGETIDTLYPTTVDDYDHRFILRLAYDGSAIFDETYAKTDFNLYKLFDDNNDSTSIVEVYHSSSLGEINTIASSILNINRIPDFVVKPIGPFKNSLKFVKLKEQTDINDFIVNNSFGNEYVYSKYINKDTLHSTSIRSFQIIYGNELDICFLGEYEIKSILEFPTELDLIDNNSYSVLSNKHYYEFATNDVAEAKGLYENTFILMETGSKEIKNIQQYEIVESYFINGYDEIMVLDWEYSGSILPSGSKPTNSVVYNNFETNNTVPVLHEFDVENGDRFYSAAGTLLLSYKEDDDLIKFRNCKSLNVGDICYDKFGNPKVITSHNIVFLNTNNAIPLRFLDVEETDNYIVSGSEIVVHNAPCFVAGTKILMNDLSEKNIEDVVVGDTIVSFNFKNEINELDIVEKTTQREINETVTYIFDDGGELEATIDHPIYVKDKGWCSYDNDLSNKMYNIGGVSKIEIGDFVKTSKSFKQITSIIENKNIVKVYNLSNIKYNHNFFANDVLVHNRLVFASMFVCFTFNTPIQMWDGSNKKIGEIEIGDEVLSYKQGKYVKGIVTDKLIHPTNAIVEVVKYKNMISDRLHPYYKNGEWKPMFELENAEFGIEYIDNFYNLEIDGNLLFDSEHNFITEGIIVSGLGDNDLLNNTFKRQEKWKFIKE
jgi:hypothetical protein